MGEKTFHLPEQAPQVPRKPRVAAPVETVSAGVKRSADDMEDTEIGVSSTKRQKIGTDEQGAGADTIDLSDDEIEIL
jgi:hypothetical protein